MPKNQILTAFIAFSILLAGGYGDVSLANASSSGTQTTYEKPHAPVDIEYKLINPSASGLADEPLTVQITLKNSVDVDDLLLSVRLASGLQSTALQAQYNFGVLAKNQLSVINFDVTASVAGRYRIYLVASVVNSGKRQGRTVIMPLTIGSVPATLNKSLDNVIIDSTGTAIISLPGTAVNSTNNEGP